MAPFPPLVASACGPPATGSRHCHRRNNSFRQGPPRAWRRRCGAAARARLPRRPRSPQRRGCWSVHRHLLRPQQRQQHHHHHHHNPPSPVYSPSSFSPGTTATTAVSSPSSSSRLRFLADDLVPAEGRHAGLMPPVPRATRPSATATPRPAHGARIRRDEGEQEVAHKMHH